MIVRFFPPTDIISAGFKYHMNQNHSVLFYEEDSEELYVGGTGFILKLDVDDFHIIEVGWTNSFLICTLFLLLFRVFCFAPFPHPLRFNRGAVAAGVIRPNRWL